MANTIMEGWINLYTVHIATLIKYSTLNSVVYYGKWL